MRAVLASSTFFALVKKVSSGHASNCTFTVGFESNRLLITFFNPTVRSVDETLARMADSSGSPGRLGGKIGIPSSFEPKLRRVKPMADATLPTTRASRC